MIKKLKFFFSMINFTYYPYCCVQRHFFLVTFCPALVFCISKSDNTDKYVLVILDVLVKTMLFIYILVNSNKVHINKYKYHTILQTVVLRLRFQHSFQRGMKYDLKYGNFKGKWCISSFQQLVGLQYPSYILKRDSFRISKRFTREFIEFEALARISKKWPFVFVLSKIYKVE